MNPTGTATSKVVIIDTEEGRMDFVAAFQTTVDQKIMQLELKLESIIRSKLDEKLEVITLFSESMKE